MEFHIQAACISNIGKVRKSNEDNLYFDDKCLNLENSGLRHPICVEKVLKQGENFAIFDGMGGEKFGEVASYVAARKIQEINRNNINFLISEKEYFYNVVSQLNNEVLKAQKEKLTEHLGTTFVSLHFSYENVYMCNIGDSRAYRLRDGEFLQLSKDHIEKNSRYSHTKAPLTQYLGMDTEEFELDPFIAKGEIKSGDIYLLCSDGLTDMMSNFEIAETIIKNNNVIDAVKELLNKALNNGGKDNISIILIKII